MLPRVAMTRCDPDHVLHATDSSYPINVDHPMQVCTTGKPASHLHDSIVLVCMPVHLSSAHFSTLPSWCDPLHSLPCRLQLKNDLHNCWTNYHVIFHQASM